MLKMKRILSTEVYKINKQDRRVEGPQAQEYSVPNQNAERSIIEKDSNEISMRHDNTGERKWP